MLSAPRKTLVRAGVANVICNQPDGKITRWPLRRDTLTVIPCEPRMMTANVVTAIKSVIPPAKWGDYLPELPQATQGEGTQSNEQLSIKSITEVTMTDNMVTMSKEDLSAWGKSLLEDFTKSLPPVNATPAQVAVTLDEADRKFKSVAEQCQAVKNFQVSAGRNFDRRLSRLEIKAGTGANESVPSEGGFMLEPEFAGQILQPMGKIGEWPFSPAVKMYPTNRQSGWGWGIDETNRATGSRWGGIRGYRIAEGDSVTASKPKFRKISWSLNKYMAVVYGTDELLADAPQFAAIVREGVGEELAFMFNDDVLNGTGVGGALGILNTAAFVSVAKETSQAATTLVYENLVKMWARLHPRSKPNAVWYANTDVMPELHTMALAVGTGGIPARFVNYADDGSLRVFGKPVVETEFNATLGTQGDIMLADLSWYLAWEKSGGVEAASSIHVAFLTDETVFRFIYRVAGEPAIAAPLTPYKGSATLSPFVVLDTRS